MAMRNNQPGIINLYLSEQYDVNIRGTRRVFAGPLASKPFFNILAGIKEFVRCSCISPPQQAVIIPLLAGGASQGLGLHKPRKGNRRRQYAAQLIFHALNIFRPVPEIGAETKDNFMHENKIRSRTGSA